jgi:hypothetical protein
MSELDAKERIDWIRQGNEAFNKQDYVRARECFVKADYGDGLIRLGDYYMYEKRLPLLAYGYYKKAGASDKVADLHRRMVSALGEWIGRDKLKPEFQVSATGTQARYVGTDADGMVRVPVGGDLLRRARQILDSK